MKELNNDLIEACRLGILPLVEILLEKGADVQAWDNYAIRWASYNGHLEVVKLLIDKGADVEVDNNYSIRLASRDGYSEIVELLKEHGAVL